MDYGDESYRPTGAEESSLLLLLLMSSLVNRYSPPSCSQKDQGELKVARTASHHNAPYLFLVARSERQSPFSLTGALGASLFSSPNVLASS